MPIANSFIFYLWRIYDVFRNAFQGLCLALRYRRIAARVKRGSFLIGLLISMGMALT